MIFDCLENADFYRGLHPRLGKAFDYLRTTDLARLPSGRIEIAGSEMFAIVQDYRTKRPEEGFWEAHRRYIDVQYVISGAERMGYANLQSMTVKQPYDEEKDLLILEGTGDACTVPAGSFTIFAPQDAHMPGLAAGEPAPARKIVVKIAV